MQNCLYCAEYANICTVCVDGSVKDSTGACIPTRSATVLPLVSAYASNSAFFTYDVANVLDSLGYGELAGTDNIAVY